MRSERQVTHTFYLSDITRLHQMHVGGFGFFCVGDSEECFFSVMLQSEIYYLSATLCGVTAGLIFMYLSTGSHSVF
jgi:hypothetical protein